MFAGACEKSRLDKEEWIDKSKEFKVGISVSVNDSL